MAPTVPAGAARLLDFVRLIEVGTDERRDYDFIYGFNPKQLDKPYTSMTVDEVIAAPRPGRSGFGPAPRAGTSSCARVCMA